MKRIFKIAMCAVLLAGCSGKKTDEPAEEQIIRVEENMVQYKDENGNWTSIMTVEELIALANEPEEMYSPEPAVETETEPVTETEPEPVESAPVIDANHRHSFMEQISSMASTCTKGGFVTYRCECGETYTVNLEPLGHDFALLYAVDPTCEHEGYKTYRCTRCSVEYTDFYPALTEGCAPVESTETEGEGTEETAEGQG